MAGLKRLGFAVLWIGAFLVMGIAVTTVLGLVIRVPRASVWWLFASSVPPLVGFCAATWAVGYLWNKYSWDGMGWQARGIGELQGGVVRGIVLGGVMAALAIGLAFVFSGATVELTGDWESWPSRALPLALGLLAAALVEELVFRGYPLRRLADAIGPWPATAAIAIGFGIAHLGNPNASFFGTVNIVLAGVWLSFAFFSHGGMPYAWGLHFGWNAGLALIFDAPVSGYTFRVPAVEYFPGGHPWVDGGAFGPEGGLAATLVLIAGTLAVIEGRFTRPRTWIAG